MTICGALRTAVYINEAEQRKEEKMKILAGLLLAVVIAFYSTAAMGAQEPNGGSSGVKVEIKTKDSAGRETTRCGILETLDIKSDGSIDVKLTGALTEANCAG